MVDSDRGVPGLFTISDSERQYSEHDENLFTLLRDAAQTPFYPNYDDDISILQNTLSLTIEKETSFTSIEQPSLMTSNSNSSKSITC